MSKSPRDPIFPRAALEEAARTNEPRPNESFGSEFLDNIAHQLVAPLQAIEMHCLNITRGFVPAEEVNQRLREVIGHARILSEFAQRLRFLHDLVSGKAIKAERLEFEKIVTTWIDGFNNYLPLVKELKFDVDIDHPTMNAFPDVIASRLAAHQVIMNLYDNALKYGTPSSKVQVRGKLEGDFVVNEISHLAKVRLTEVAAGQIFQRGFRAPEAQAVLASGSGLGMWISKQLMSAMQGDIKAIATDAKGITRFRLYWRVAK